MHNLRTCFIRLCSVAVGIFLAGCFEINSTADFDDRGGAKVKIEFAVSGELMALAATPAFQKDGQSPADLLNKCGETISSDHWPKGVKSIKSTPGQRSGMFTCTIEAEVTDPVAAVESAEHNQSSEHNLTIEKLAGRDGYRIAAKLAPNSEDKSQSKEPGDQLATSVAIAMFANRFVTITISGLRVENHNGEGAPDQRSATWKIPVLGLIGPGATKPFKIQADVIYAESWYIRWKRKLFG